MPRQPTGKPRGRPKGSGELGEQTRLTVRIPLALYERLTAFAEGRSYSRGAPQLAVCVREALEEYLANKGQTENIPLAQGENNRQTENDPSGDIHISGQTEKYISGQTTIVQESIRESLRQTENVPTVRSDINRQTIKVPEGAEDNYGQTENDAKPQAANLRQTEKSTPVYDTSKYVLGKLCPRRHEHGSTGQSLLRISNRHCIACDREKFHERKAGKAGHYGLA